jgi:guanylate kinase
MSIKEKLLYLVRYYNSARHCGHTNAILFGMKRNPKAMMLTIDAQGMRQLKHRIPEMDVITIDELGKLEWTAPSSDD